MYISTSETIKYSVNLWVQYSQSGYYSWCKLHLTAMDLLAGDEINALPFAAFLHQTQYKPGCETWPGSLRWENGLKKPKLIRLRLIHFMRFTVYSLPFLLKFRTRDKNSLSIKAKYHCPPPLHSSTENVLQSLQIQHNVYLLINNPHANCKFSCKLQHKATRHFVKAVWTFHPSFS